MTMRKYFNQVQLNKMKQFVKLFNKVGGKALFKQYLKAHVLLFAVFQILSQGFSRKSLELVRICK